MSSNDSSCLGNQEHYTSEITDFLDVTLDLGSIPGAAMLDRSFILATSAIHLIIVVPACLLGLIYVKVTSNSLIHPAIGEKKCTD